MSIVNRTVIRYPIAAWIIFFKSDAVEIKILHAAPAREIPLYLKIAFN